MVLQTGKYIAKDDYTNNTISRLRELKYSPLAMKLIGYQGLCKVDSESSFCLAMMKFKLWMYR
jgi:hypothetical protein